MTATRRGPPAHGAAPGRPLDEKKITGLLDRLVVRVVSLESVDLRARIVATHLATLTPAELVFVGGLLVRRARDDRRAAATVSAVSRALALDLLDPDQIASTLAQARSRADRLAEALFAQGPALRTYDSNDEPFVDRRIRAIPLGQRRALARSRDIDLLLRLAHDQDPRVIRSLLTNPRFTERDAVIVAARRPTHVHVLEEVLRSRFGLSPRVREAVAHNPYAPVALAARAMATLSLPQLRALADDEKLADQVRRQARALAVSRRPTPAERSRAATSPEESTPELEALLEQLATEESDPECDP